jgi:S1-C subfamily serine protease
VVKAVGVGSGSGCLILYRGKSLVATNRHVIENASRGVTVHFLTGDGKGRVKETVVPATDTRVIAVHRTADLALVDVSAGADLIGPLGIDPLRLAPPDHRPEEGERAFAIGHPGAGGRKLLTQTLSNGIISRGPREMDGATVIQTTVPTNPGNSGGPLFDEEGRVTGINTFVIRKGEDDISREGLNFALQVRYVHELLTDPTKSLTREQIAAVLGRLTETQKAELALALEPRLARAQRAGYRPALDEEGQPLRKFLHLPARKNQPLPFFLDGGEDYAVLAVGLGTDDIDLTVFALGQRRPLALDWRPDAHPR